MLRPKWPPRPWAELCCGDTGLFSVLTAPAPVLQKRTLRPGEAESRPKPARLLAGPGGQGNPHGKGGTRPLSQGRRNYEKSS